MKVNVLKDAKIALDFHARRCLNVKAGDSIDLEGHVLQHYLDYGYVKVEEKELKEDKKADDEAVKVEEKELKEDKKKSKELKDAKKTK